MARLEALNRRVEQGVGCLQLCRGRVDVDLQLIGRRDAPEHVHMLGRSTLVRMAQDIDGDERLAEVETVLRSHRAEFAFLHGSRAVGTASPDSDLDVAAWFGRDVDALEVRADLPAGVDLLVLDTAPLELAGRVAQHGVLLFESDAAARVRWQARTRKIYLDEQPRIAQARRDFVRARTRG